MAEEWSMMLVFDKYVDFPICKHCYEKVKDMWELNKDWNGYSGMYQNEERKNRWTDSEYCFLCEVKKRLDIQLDLGHNCPDCSNNKSEILTQDQWYKMHKCIECGHNYTTKIED